MPRAVGQIEFQRFAFAGRDRELQRHAWNVQARIAHLEISAAPQ